jgi:hypothetical protein
MKFVRYIAILTLFIISSCQNISSAPIESANHSSANHSDLDLLKNYDRELWSGPDGWSTEQWQWKRTLRWDKNCDYIGEVEVYNIDPKYQLVTVQCVPGSYQPTYYAYIFDKHSKESKQLSLGSTQNTDESKEISGTLNYNHSNQQLSILTLSRGLGDCGIFRSFDFKSGKDTQESEFKLIESRERDCVNHNVDIEQLPGEIFDYFSWPKIN